MALVLDTSVLIDIERKRKTTIDKIKEIYKSHITPPKITFINYFEFYEGLIEKNVKSRNALMSFINKFPCLHASKITAEILANLKYRYEKKGIVIGLADLIIASQVIETNATLITKDKTFEKIDEINKIILD